MRDEAARIRAAIALYGRSLTLRRRVGTTSSYTDVSVKGVVVGYRPEELVGGIAQGDRRVLIANQEIAAASWPGPPRKGDVVMIDGTMTTVQGNDPKYLGTDVVAHILWVRG